MIQAEETQGHFRMSDGFKLFYRCWTSQRKAEKTVVCIHGGGDHSGWFRVVGPELAVNGTEVYALDLRGFGGSEEEGFLRGDPSDFNRHLQGLDEVVAGLKNQFGWKICMPKDLRNHSVVCVGASIVRGNVSFDFVDFGKTARREGISVHKRRSQRGLRIQCAPTS